MIRNPLPAYVLALLAMLLLAARLNVLDPRDAGLWFLEGVALLVALLTRAIGERELPGGPGGPGASATTGPGATPSPLRDLRSNQPPGA